MSPAVDWNVPREVAVPRLLEQYGGRLHALGRQVCGNADAAQDLVQEIFVQAWRKWQQFDGRSDPLYWLFTIARRTCQRMHRKRRGEPRRMESLDELLPFGRPELAVVPRERLAHPEEQQEELGAAIAALPDEFRMPLILKEIVGFSIEEVAGILGLQANTVKTRVHRARLRLRKALVEGLPQQKLPPTPYSQQVCLDLLRAKQQALDLGAPMPNADAIVCERCQAVFASLDWTQEACKTLAQGPLPDALRARLAQQWHGEAPQRQPRRQKANRAPR
ncbi:MAG: RNA polymerase sigma factor [Planctomycetes bacterium]|nr:RNA polymerase sigma factor [Planctomycetota bacterium]